PRRVSAGSAPSRGAAPVARLTPGAPYQIRRSAGSDLRRIRRRALRGARLASDGGALAEAAGELPEGLEDAHQDVEAEEPHQDELGLRLVRDDRARPDGGGDQEDGAGVELHVLERPEPDGADHQEREADGHREERPDVLGAAEDARGGVV